MTDHPNGTTLAPKVRGVSVKLTSPMGALYFAGRSGFRYFVTGHPVIGRPRDNATWLQDATQDYRGGPVAKYGRARWRRVARRNAIVGVPGGLLSLEGLSTVVRVPMEHMGAAPPGWTEIPWDTLAQGYVCVAVAGAVAYAYPKLKAYHEARELRREVIHPATKVACQILGQRWDRRKALHMLELPAGFGEPSDDDAQPEARLYLPPVPLDKGTKARIESSVGARLGIPNATGEWQEFGGKAWVQLRGADVPPKAITMGTVVKLEDEGSTTLREAIERADKAHPVAGVASGGRIVAFDYADASPNVAMSGGTGTGKSTFLRLILAQRLRHGSGLICLDLKGISHGWVYRLPKTRALYFHEIQDIHEACVEIGAELWRRRDEAVKSKRAGMGMPDFRDLDVIVEEANSLIVDLQSYWTNRRAEIKRENRAALELDPDADVTEPPLRSPAVDALGFLIQMGRELCAFPHYAGQRLSAVAFGGQGGDRRESFQQRALAKWTRATWRMLCPDVPYRVCPSGPRGIWAVVRGDRVDIIRVPDMSEDQAVSMVLDSPDPGTPVLSGHRTPARTIDGQTVQVDRLASVRGQRVSLSEAVDRTGLTLEALRVASKRADGFPAPVEDPGPGKPKRYDLAELIEWREGRDRVLVQVGPGGGSESP